MHWGDGFITNEDVIKAYGLSDPSPLFSSGTFKELGFLPGSLQAKPPQSLQVSGGCRCRAAAAGGWASGC